MFVIDIQRKHFGIFLLFLLSWFFANDAQSALLDDLVPKSIGTKDLVISIQTAVLHNNEEYAANDYRRAGFQEAAWLYKSFFDADRKKLYQEATRLAESGNSTAQLMLGLLYFGGLGVEQSLQSAELWWSRALVAGYPETDYVLGILQLISGGRDEEALSHLRKSAELGYPDAMVISALTYFIGHEGFPQSNARFYLWAKQAQFLNASLLDKTNVRWPLNRDPIPYTPLPLVLAMAESNASASEYDAEYQIILADTLLSYVKHCYVAPNLDTITPENLAKMIHDSALLRSVLGSQGTMRRLAEQPERESMETLAKMASQFPQDKYEIIYHERYAQGLPGSQSLPIGTISRRLCPGTVVLLSDRVIHHYAFIYAVDLESQEVLIADGWAGESFLLEGNNSLMISGQLVPSIHGRHLIKISLGELNQTLVGAIVPR